MWYKIYTLDNIMIVYDGEKEIGRYDCGRSGAMHMAFTGHGNHNVMYETAQRVPLSQSDESDTIAEPPYFWHPSPHFSLRRGVKVDTIILHNTYGPYADSVKYLSDPNRVRDRTSCHIVIPRDPADSEAFGKENHGKVAALVNEKYSAWHAGSRTMNAQSIGIEITVDKNQFGMTAWQEKSVIDHCKWLCKKYGLTYKAIRIHREFSDTSCPSLIWPENSDFYKWRKKHFGV